VFDCIVKGEVAQHALTISCRASKLAYSRRCYISAAGYVSVICMGSAPRLVSGMNAALLVSGIIGLPRQDAEAGQALR
jgi:hypothetical protein